MRKKTDESLKSWNCRVCAPAVEKNGSCHAVLFCSDEKDLAGEVAAMREKLGKLMTLSEKIDSLLDLKKTATYLKKTVGYMSAKYARVLSDLPMRAREIADISTRLAHVEITSSKMEVRELQMQGNNLEHYGPRQNLGIHGTPQSRDESPLDIVKDVAQDLSLPLLFEEDSDGTQRLHSKPTYVPPSSVGFLSRKTK
ncbi:hypothetical protein HPB48_005240 [Haemaphysalis longicornis]|uniref:Uncharacterized protein n=1 Tax=Haemaphysalis longicornis TaxID=44386 RepID=A0A9J6FVM2_HAELO|nr:hypothetical protein HPB48_005240 [Haemaphysalis longicornis]